MHPRSSTAAQLLAKARQRARLSHGKVFVLQLPDHLTAVASAACTCFRASLGLSSCATTLVTPTWCCSDCNAVGSDGNVSALVPLCLPKFTVQGQAFPKSLSPAVHLKSDISPLTVKRLLDAAACPRLVAFYF